MRSQEKDFADGLNRGWLNRQLKEDENVIWIGKPVPGKLFHGYDAVMVPFSLAWCAMSLLFVTQFSEEDSFRRIRHRVFRVWPVFADRPFFPCTDNETQYGLYCDHEKDSQASG